MFICILRIWLGLLDAFMPVAPKPPDYSADISLKKAIFQNILDEKCQSKSKATTHFQIFCILLTYLKIISISMKGPDDTCDGDLQAWMGYTSVWRQKFMFAIRDNCQAAGSDPL